MEVGIFAPLSSFNVQSDFVRALGPAVEERGFESIWVPEHVVLFDEYESKYPYSPDGKFPGGGETGLLEPLTALTYLAAVTDRVRLGTAVVLVPQRNPVYLAKQVADLDVLSGGRVELGIGIGWLEEEFDALNVPFARRGVRTNDCLKVMRSLWTDDVSSYEGETYTLPPARFYPKPVQDPVPILVGGESDAALKRAARYGQGWFTFNRQPDEVGPALARLDAALADAGRARGAGFTVTLSPYFAGVDKAGIEAYAEAGVERLVVMALAFTRDDLLTTLDTLAADVLAPAQAAG
jgi:probable F420-dependent oxidoreductase